MPAALELQFVESEVIRRAMVLLWHQGIGSLPVYDSLIVDLEHLEEAGRTLEGPVRDQVKVEIGRPSQHHARVSLKAGW